MMVLQLKPKAASMAKSTKKSTTTEAEVIPPNPPDVDNKAIVVRDEKPKKAARVKRDSAMSIVGTVTTEQLRQALDTQTEQRQLIEDFIKKHLREDRDFGVIHVVNKDRCPAEKKQPGSCTVEYHFSKPILFKPGQEKIFSLFSITDDLVKDEETFTMLGNVPGLVAYKCIMFQKGKKIGEGRGAAQLASERSDPNSTIKKAEKRARMDACLSLGFSEYFTQDLDDPDYASQREMANSKAAAAAEIKDKDEFGLLPRDPEEPISNSERAVLHRILVKAGFTESDEILELLRINGITDPQVMTSGQARGMMGKVAHGMFASPEVRIEPEEPPKPEQPPAPAQPELIIDDQFKEEISNRVQHIAFTARGQMWLLQRSIGRPFVKWETLTDKQFGEIYQVLLAIEDGRIEVEDHYLRGVIPTDDTDNVNIEPEQASLLEEEKDVQNVEE